MSTVRRSLQLQEMTNPSGLCSARSRHLLGSYISGQRTMVDFWGFLRSCWAHHPPFWSILGGTSIAIPPKKIPRISENYIYIYIIYICTILYIFHLLGLSRQKMTLDPPTLGLLDCFTPFTSALSLTEMSPLAALGIWRHQSCPNWWSHTDSDI